MSLPCWSNAEAEPPDGPTVTLLALSTRADPEGPIPVLFTGGTIHKVVYDVADGANIDIENEFGARMASD